MSDGEPSSIKRLTRCAARVPALSSGYEDRVAEKLDLAVYGSRFAAHILFIEKTKNCNMFNYYAKGEGKCIRHYTENGVLAALTRFTVRSILRLFSNMRSPITSFPMRIFFAVLAEQEKPLVPRYLLRRSTVCLRKTEALAESCNASAQSARCSRSIFCP